MAETNITIAQFQTELGRVKTAIRARDWDTAHTELAAAEITLSGLEEQVGDAGTTIKYRTQLDGARKALESAKAGVGQSSSKARFAFGRTGYGRSC